MSSARLIGPRLRNQGLTQRVISGCRSDAPLASAGASSRYTQATRLSGRRRACRRARLSSGGTSLLLIIRAVRLLAACLMAICVIGTATAQRQAARSRSPSPRPAEPPDLRPAAPASTRAAPARVAVLSRRSRSRATSGSRPGRSGRICWSSPAIRSTRIGSIAA